MHGKICMGKFDTYIPSLESPSYDIQHTIIMVVVAVRGPNFKGECTQMPHGYRVSLDMSQTGNTKL